MKLFAPVIFLMTVTAAACSQRPQVAVITEGADPEQEGLVRMISEAGYDCSAVGMDADFAAYDVVWYHRPDTTDLTEAEIGLGESLVPYVENGGSLVLSLDAVKLSNAWGLEPKPVDVWSEEAVDWGFGRQVGYHSMRSHPLFDGLFGGAYVWHGHEDNVNRVLGYNGDNVPEKSKIIATLWEYIFYQPSQKVVWEQKIGKGSILSIGAVLYYSKPNHHDAILRKFTDNVVKFMGGMVSGTPGRYWEYDPVGVIFENALSLRAPKAKKPGKWSPAEGDFLAFEGNRNEVTLPSRRALVVCEEQSGIKEIWTHPIMSLRDYVVTAILHDSTEVRLGKASSEVVLRYNCLEREYEAGDVTVRETIVPSVSGPAVVAHYEWDGELLALKVEFSSNMRYMWPYAEDALGSLYCGWNGTAGCYSVRDVNSEFVSLVGANCPGKLVYEKQDRDLLQVRAGVEFMTSGSEACDVVMCAGNEGLAKVEKDYVSALRNPENVLKESASYYDRYLASTVSIETPDEDFNEGYRWAVVSAGQFLAETPGLGTGLMAGYSSSQRGWGGGHRVSGRPGYAWYFGRDSELSALAFLSMGDSDAVKKTLELLADYQNVNGKVFHELVTSGSDHFDASDATPLFVVLMAEYVRATGDVDFAKTHIQNVLKAIEYCKSTDTDGDNLIEIQHVGHGWLEGTFTPKTPKTYKSKNGAVHEYDKVIVRCIHAVEPKDCVGDVFDLVEYGAYTYNEEKDTNELVEIAFQGVDWASIFRSVTFNMEKIAFDNATTYSWDILGWCIETWALRADLFIQPSGDMILHYYYPAEVTDVKTGETIALSFFRVHFKKHKDIPFKMEDVLGYWVPVKTAYYYELKKWEDLALQDYYEIFNELSYASVAGDNIVLDGDDFPLTYNGDSFDVTGITNFNSHNFTVNAEGNLVERIERKSSAIITIRGHYCQFDDVVTEYIKAKPLDYAIGGKYVLVNQDFYQGGKYKGSATDGFLESSELKEFKLTEGQGLNGSSYSEVGPWMMIENILGRSYCGFIREKDDAFVFVSNGEASSVTVKDGGTINYNTTILTYKRADK